MDRILSFQDVLPVLAIQDEQRQSYSWLMRELVRQALTKLVLKIDDESIDFPP